MFSQQSSSVSDLYDKTIFCHNNYSTIRDTFWFFCRNDELTDDLTHELIVRKILPDDGLIEKYLNLRQTSKASGESYPSFRSYLVSSIRNAYFDHVDKVNRGKEKQAPFEGSPILDIPDREHAVEDIDEESLYAYAVLNRALHGVRKYCHENEMGAYWTIFDELVLARLDDSRKQLTREELRLRFFPNEKKNNKLDERLTTVKRILRRELWHILKRDPLAEKIKNSSESVLDEWIGSLKSCKSGVHGALVAATRVGNPDESHFELHNSKSVMDVRQPDEMIEKELGFSLALRLRLPINEWAEWSEPGEFLRLLPAGSTFLPDRRGKKRATPLTLELLMQPKLENIDDLRYANVDEILRRVKDLARNLSREDCHPVDDQLFKLVYTLAITIARVGFGKVITSLSVQDQHQGIWFFIGQNWVDENTKAYFRKAVTTPGIWHDC